MKIKGSALLSALLICIALSGIAYGDSVSNTGTNTVGATLGASISVSATPTTLTSSHSPIAPGDTATGDSTVTVTANALWTLSAKADTDKMMSGSNPLGANLMVSMSETTPYTYSVIDTGHPTESLASGSATGSPGIQKAAHFSQVFGTDDVAGDYTVTITWTGTATF